MKCPHQAWPGWRSLVKDEDPKDAQVLTPVAFLWSLAKAIYLTDSRRCVSAAIHNYHETAIVKPLVLIQHIPLSALYLRRVYQQGWVGDRTEAGGAG